MPVSNEELRQTIRNKTDGELYDVLYTHSGDYTADAIACAKEEFQHRQLDAATISNIHAGAEIQLKHENESLPWSRKWFAFFLGPIFFAIPALLAHRRYTEKGQTRKAREFAVWTLYGFGFYLTLSIVRAFLLR